MPEPVGHIVGVGQIALDILGVTAKFPEPETRLVLAEVSIQGGGAVATALATAATLGAKAHAVGHVGPDRLGQLSLDLLAGDGVDVSGVRLGSGVLSPFNFIIIAADTHQRSTLVTEGDVAPPEPTALDLGVLEGAAVLLLDGLDGKGQAAAAARARALGVPIVLDVSGMAPDTMALVGVADHLIASERFANEAAPQGELEDALVELARLGPRHVIITQGRAGSLGRGADGKLVRQPAIGPPALDKTGVGSVFHGAYGYAVMRGWPFERALAFASAVAGLSGRSRGARAGLPTLQEVRGLLEWVS